MYFCSVKQRQQVPVAQLVEQLTLNQWVQGSNPCGDTPKRRTQNVLLFSFSRPSFSKSELFFVFLQSINYNLCQTKKTK